MTGSTGPRCRTCGKPIVGCAETKFGGGWVHVRSNAERCPAPHRSFAATVTSEDLNRKTLADAERGRRRRGIPARFT